MLPAMEGYPDQELHTCGGGVCFWTNSSAHWVLAIINHHCQFLVSLWRNRALRCENRPWLIDDFGRARPPDTPCLASTSWSYHKHVHTANPSSSMLMVVMEGCQCKHVSLVCTVFTRLDSDRHTLFWPVSWRQVWGKVNSVFHQSEWMLSSLSYYNIIMSNGVENWKSSRMPNSIFELEFRKYYINV